MWVNSDKSLLGWLVAKVTPCVSFCCIDYTLMHSFQSLTRHGVAVVCVVS